MENREIAEILRDIAVYMELNGENPFKLRAFDRAARTIEAGSEDIARLAREKRLTEIKGIGKGLAEAIEEIVERGESSVLTAMRASTPPGLTDLLEISGMGPKKVRTVWKELGIESPGELEYACTENRLVALPGFGEKSQEKILKSILFRKRFASQYLFSDALAIAEETVKALEDLGCFESIDITGSLRRGTNIFKDVDVLLVPEEKMSGEEVQNTLVSLADSGPDIEGVIGAGDTRVTIRRKGLQIDFRIVDGKAHPAALQHFTGSREHNTRLRVRAKKMGLKMNGYGVFRNDRALDLKEERDVYGSAGLLWVPPELREGLGELEAADAAELPELVTEKDFRGMIHVHSRFSDGRNSIEDLAKACIRRGYSYLCLTDHSRSAFYAGGLSAEGLKTQREEVSALNDILVPFRIFCGVESDILADGSLDYPDEVLKELDFVIGSVHSNLSMKSGEATERLIRAVKNPFLHILGHPSGRLLLSREGYSYDEERLLDVLAEEGVALEHNCNPHRLDADWRLMKKAGERGIPVAVDPDAHDVSGFDDMRYGVTMARKAWLRRENVLNCLETGGISEYFTKR